MQSLDTFPVKNSLILVSIYNFLRQIIIMKIIKEVRTVPEFHEEFIVLAVEYVHPPWRFDIHYL